MDKALRYSVVFFIWVCTVLPAGVRALCFDRPAFAQTERTGNASDPNAVPSGERRFRLEVYGGNLAIDPKDLNLFPAYADRLQSPLPA